MIVRVRLFATLADLAGAQELEIDVDAEATVETLWGALGERHPGLAELDYRPMAACDLEYVDWAQSLSGVKEVAFLPPVSGG